MKIEVVQLENIRSHVKSTVPFTNGFNCVVGGVGCGKSSIMYAVDFALFGDPVARSFEYLLRDGADCGKVFVQFSQNGKTYKVTRGLIRKGKSISQDSDSLKLYEEDVLIASIKNDAVAEQIKIITGLNRELYREIVWFRQEHLKDLLDAAPRDRQKRIDELFGLSDYEAAWSNIVNYQREYEAEKRVRAENSNVINLEKLDNDHNRACEDFTNIEMDIEELTQNLVNTKLVLEKADESLEFLEKNKRKSEEFQHKMVQIQATLKNVTYTLTSLMQKINDKKILLDNLTQRQRSIETQKKLCLSQLEQAGLPTIQSFNQITSFLAEFDDKISQMRGEQEAAVKGIQTDQKRLSQLSQEDTQDDRCPLCVQPLTGQYKADLLVRIEQETVERQKNINHLRLEIADLQKAKSIASDAYSNLQTCLANETNLKDRISEEENNFVKLNEEFDAQKKFETDQKIQYSQNQEKILQFDVVDLDAARAHREQTFKQYYRLESDCRVNENRKKDLLRNIDEIKIRIERAHETIERIAKLERAIELIGAIRDVYRSIQPKLRKEFVKILQNSIQQILDRLTSNEASLLNVIIDETYTPYVQSLSGTVREVSVLSGGERTLLAFAYRLGLGQLIMQSQTGHGLNILMLDEPTENLGNEDGSITHLAEAISNLRTIEQIIAVTHSETFADKATNVISLEKEAGVSKISIER